MKNKKFLITIDTEGDNLWAWREGDPIRTENTLYLPRFQTLCEGYGMKPVYLSNYEMLSDERFCAFAKEKQDKGLCEIGMHLHAWNCPPLEETLTPRRDCVPGAAYLIEYSEKAMEEKIRFMTDLITEKTGLPPVSHRAGRWATNDVYFRLLQKYGYKIDCSVTPRLDWSSHPGCSPESGGSDYRRSPDTPYTIPGTALTEYPVTVYQDHRIYLPDHLTPKNIARSLVHAKRGNLLWLRPNGNNLKECLGVMERSAGEADKSYVMFMLHSSELMPGGSPAFRDEGAIEHLYRELNAIFARAQSLGYVGATFREELEKNA